MTTVSPIAPPPASTEEGEGIHPLVHAGRAFLGDLFSTLVFVALFALTKDVFVATGVAIVGGVFQLAYLKLRNRPIDAMQWMSLILVVVFGGASLLTHDPHFMMLKISVVKCAIGAVMLRKGWMIRYVPAQAVSWTRDLIIGFGYVWAALMFATALLNVAVAYTVDAKTWAWFIGVFPTASMIGLFGLQYITMNAIGTRRARAAGVDV